MAECLSCSESPSHTHTHIYIISFSHTAAFSKPYDVGPISITLPTLTLPHHHPATTLPPCHPPSLTVSCLPRKSLGRRTRSPALSRGRVESNTRRRPQLRSLRRRHPHNRPANTSEGGRRRTGRGSRRERVGRRENAERKRRLLGKRHERRRRIGRDGRRRLLPNTNDDVVTRRRPTPDAER